MIVSRPLLRAMGEGFAWMARRRLRVRVTGRSMVPTLADGEFVLVDTHHRPRVGQLVVVHHPTRPDLLIVKRLTGYDTEGLMLSSDNVDEGSDSRTFGAVSPDRLVGTVTLVLDRPTTGPDLGW